MTERHDFLPACTLTEDTICSLYRPTHHV